MSQRMLHVTLNTGRMSVQSPDVGWPVTLRVLRSRVARLLNRPPSVHPPWLRLPVPFVPFELTGTQDSAAPLFFVRRGWEEKILASFVVGTNSAADADLWEVIHRLGRAELPRRPVTHPLYRPPGPWCTTVHHTGWRKVAAATAIRLGEIERGVTWAVVELMNGEG